MQSDSIKPVILIPARYQSSRFPGKPLAKINGKPMILHVYENMEESGFDVFVVTDNEEIQELVEREGGEVLRIDDEVPSGSERIGLALKRFLDQKYNLIINVQGDEPLLKGSTIQRLAKSHGESDFDIMTLVRKRVEEEADLNSHHVVKVVYNPRNKQCQYFSRSPVPFASMEWFQHIGVYSYKPEALLGFIDLPRGEWEAAENLEQLRALENKMQIGAIETQERLMGVDIPEDIETVERYLDGQ